MKAHPKGMSPTGQWIIGGGAALVIAGVALGIYAAMGGFSPRKVYVPGKKILQPKDVEGKRKTRAGGGSSTVPASTPKQVALLPAEKAPTIERPVIQPAVETPPVTTPEVTPSPAPAETPTTPSPSQSPTSENPPTPETPAPDSAPSKPEPKTSPAEPAPAPEPAPETRPEKEAKPAKKPPAKESKKTPPKAAGKNSGKKPAGPAEPVATADCENCRFTGLVPLKKPQPYVWMEGQAVPKGEQAVREQFCPNCKPDADGTVLAAAEDERLKTAMDVHLEWEKKTTWPLVRAETRRVTLHSQLPTQDTQRVALALEAMQQQVQTVTGSLELTPTTPANCQMILLWQKPNYLQFVELLKADPVYGPARQDWSLVKEVGGTWVKETIFFRSQPEGPPPEHQAVSLLASYQLRMATGYKDPSWLNVGYAAWCENVTLHANRVTSLEYTVNNLQIDPDWSLAVRRLAAVGGLKPWNDMFPMLLRDYKAEDHLTAYAMVAFLIQYQPQKFLDLAKEIRGGLPAPEAIEKAYGEKVPDLQQRWVKALTGGR